MADNGRVGDPAAGEPESSGSLWRVIRSMFVSDVDQSLRAQIEEVIDEHESEAGSAAAGEGDLSVLERQMLRNLLHFSENDADDVAVPRGEAWLHEVKFDGYRLIARLDGGECTLWTRNGLDWSARFPWLVAALAERLGSETAILDGELVLTALHPGRSADEARANTGWPLRVADELTETPPPTADELRLLREELDPTGIYLKGGA